MMVRVVVAVVLCGLLAGCSEFLGMCGPQYSGATWQEVGLYGAVQGIAPDVPPPAGLPFVSVDEPSLSLQRVELFSERWFDSHGPAWITIDARGLVTLDVDNRTSRLQAESGLRRFLENVTSAPPGKIAEWAATAQDEALAWGVNDRERHVEFTVHRYTILVQGPYRLEELFNSTMASLPEWPSCVVRPIHACAKLGEVVHSNDEWTFRFVLPTRAITLPDGFSFEVDARDRAVAEFAGFEEDEGRARQKILDGLARAGIPSTGAQFAQMNYAIC